MPNIFVKVPKNAFPGDAAKKLLRELTNAAATAEQIPDDPKFRVTSWVVIDEVEPRLFGVGGEDMSDRIIPCIAVVYIPEGVLDAASQSLCVRLIDDAFKHSLPTGEKRRLATSVILNNVADGTWGGSGRIMHLADIAKSAGYKHLQHLVTND